MKIPRDEGGSRGRWFDDIVGNPLVEITQDLGEGASDAGGVC